MTQQEFQELMAKAKADFPNQGPRRKNAPGFVCSLKDIPLSLEVFETPAGQFNYMRFYSGASLKEGEEGGLFGLWLFDRTKKIFEPCVQCIDVKLIDRSNQGEPGGDEGSIVRISLQNQLLVQLSAHNFENSLSNFVKLLNEMNGNSDSISTEIKNYNTQTRELKQYAEARRQNKHYEPMKENSTMNSESNGQDKSMIETIKQLLEANFQVILTGAPGTGKTYTARQVAFAMTGDDPEAETHPHIKSVQFHPGYDYSDFVIGMKPEIVDGGNGCKAVSFEWRRGIFNKFAAEAKAAYDKAKGDNVEPPNYVFLIDEINRADLSRVFGELFSLLEEEYRYPNNKKGITLPNGETFVIPKNLYIIGTMNDIDRSVESMDFALRRRFAWKEVKASDTQNDILDAVDKSGNRKIAQSDASKLKSAMNALNKEIGCEEGSQLDLRLGTAYQLGGAIFAKFEKCNGIFNALWENHISNVLGEYLRGRRDRDGILKALKAIFDKATRGGNSEQPPEQRPEVPSAPADQQVTPQA